MSFAGMQKSKPRFLRALFDFLSLWNRPGARPASALAETAIFSEAMNALSIPLAVLGKDGLLLYRNPAWQERVAPWGLPGLTQIGQDWTAHDLCLPGGQQIPKDIAQVMGRARDQGVHELCIQEGDVPRSLMLEARRSKSGNFTILCLRDVSQERRLELSLRQTEAQLRQSQRVESLGRIAGGVAHDFNNLVTIITSCCDLLLHGRLGEEAAHDLIAEIRTAAERSSSLARRLVASGRSQLAAPAAVDLNALLIHITKMMGGLLGEKVEVITSPEPGLGNALIDAGQMEQVVINLVLNARDAMPEGGRLTLGTHRVVLDESYREQHPGIESGNYLLLTVSDTGSGMSEEIKKHLFEPYFTTKEEGKGTGLGLSIVRAIVRQYGGHMEVVSAPGQGSTFLIYLLEVTTPATTSEREGRSDVAARGTETILLVEDVEGVRRAVCQLLELSGYHVLEAANGMEAIARMETHAGQVDLLLSDMVLPQMSGPQIAETLRFKNPALKTVFLSGYEDEDLVQGQIAHQMTEILRKPFGPDELVRRVRCALDTPQTPALPRGHGLGSPHGQLLANGTRLQEPSGQS
jgi:signal transduction histidine kinase/CheY-like chemotaxis protein